MSSINVLFVTTLEIIRTKLILLYDTDDSLFEARAFKLNIF